MTTPAHAIQDEIHQLIHFQIETFGQRVPLDSFQLEEHHRRVQKIRTLGMELDQIGTTRVVEQWRKTA